MNAVAQVIGRAVISATIAITVLAIYDHVVNPAINKIKSK